MANATRQYAENPTFKRLTEVAFKIGKNLPRKDRTALQEVAKKTRDSRIEPPTQKTIGDFADLGAITTRYGGSTKFEKFHPGVDIAAPIGTSVPAFTGGTVIDIRSGQKNTPTTPSFGNYVVIKDDSGNFQRYSHLNKGFVPVGSKVKKGQVIGEIGATGGAYSLHGGTGAHLDYRIYNAAKKYYNPSTYLSKNK